jgi:hypothetical protein
VSPDGQMTAARSETYGGAIIPFLPFTSRNACSPVQLEPIRIPAASTKAPPIITFAAADSGGTSM